MIRSKVYHGLINVKQWFDYARIISAPLFFFLTLIANFSILIIYMGFERNASLLVAISIVTTILMVISGYLLFTRKVQPDDETMKLWRNVIPYFHNVAMLNGLNQLFKKFDLKIPEYFHSWGFNNWEQTDKLLEYMLQKGIEAKARKIIKEFLK